MKRYYSSIFMALLTLSMGCKFDESFPNLGDKIASPVDIAVDQAGTTFFVLNSDFDRTYNKGSLLLLDENGEKLSALPLRRLGRGLRVSGNRLFIIYDRLLDEDLEAKVELYNIDDPRNPILLSEQSLPCSSPVNLVSRENYDYFAITCSDGHLLMGTQSPFNVQAVRKYSVVRRALHMDTTRGILFAFVTDLGRQTYEDALYTDEKSYTEDGIESLEPNEVPDEFESRSAIRRSKGRRRPYQFVVYDIQAEAEKGFPFVAEETKTTPIYDKERRWTYFYLKDAQGLPEAANGLENPNQKFYRTNFWDATPDPYDPNKFYLSHRGVSPAKQANNVIEVQITGDVAARDQEVPPNTEDVLSFERIYGFAGEVDVNGKHYPGALKVQSVDGQKLLVVNHFRDLVYWDNNLQYSIAAKVIGNNNWLNEIKQTSALESFFQVAVTKTGRAMSCLFYGNAVSVMDISPLEGINIIRRVE